MDQTQISKETDLEAYTKRLQEFVQSDRRIHFHAYGPRLLNTLINYAARVLNIGVDVVDSDYHEYRNEILLVLRKTTSKPAIPETYLLEPIRTQKSDDILCEIASENEGKQFHVRLKNEAT